MPIRLRHSAVLAPTLALAVLASGSAMAEPTGLASSGSGSTQGAACLDASTTLPYEESFLARSEAGRLIVGGGFDDTVAAFSAALCAASGPEVAGAVVDGHGAALWRLGVDRVQGRVDTGGTLSAGDDRPLYWARLAMVAALRQWSPDFTVGDDERQSLIDDLDRVSRGQRDIAFPAADKITRVLVTGFDPFTLNRDVRQANPSGASALALDGLTVKGPDGPIRIEAALFPVRWRDFEDGMVEQTLLPHFRPGKKQVDVFATTSQGRVGRIDLEHFNGAWRAGFGDNENVCYRGMAPIPAGTPTVTPQPQWTLSTHPIAAMIAAGTGPYPVNDNRTVTEVPASTPPEPVTTSCPAAPSPGTTLTTGPTPGSLARAGGGGNYLSNEIAYRATLLRDATGLDVPGGHVHTPVLQGLDPTKPDELTNATFEANRAAINAQMRQLVLAAARQ
ncbi:pyroglutamyl peptidase [Knoellia sp. S7-12]|uniref:pyroglutamyl peptidase n=1 Tax=Knoellia sp. S7-12 TaxID=3126698 RepID=UPI0033692D6E